MISGLWLHPETVDLVRLTFEAIFSGRIVETLALVPLTHELLAATSALARRTFGLRAMTTGYMDQEVLQGGELGLPCLVVQGDDPGATVQSVALRTEARVLITDLAVLRIHPGVTCVRRDRVTCRRCVKIPADNHHHLEEI